MKRIEGSRGTEINEIDVGGDGKGGKADGVEESVAGEFGEERVRERAEGKSGNERERE